MLRSGETSGRDFKPSRYSINRSLAADIDDLFSVRRIAYVKPRVTVGDPIRIKLRYYHKLADVRATGRSWDACDFYSDDRASECSLPSVAILAPDDSAHPNSPSDPAHYHESSHTLCEHSRSHMTNPSITILNDPTQSPTNATPPQSFDSPDPHCDASLNDGPTSTICVRTIGTSMRFFDCVCRVSMTLTVF